MVAVCMRKSEGRLGNCNTHWLAMRSEVIRGNLKECGESVTLCSKGLLG